MAKFHFIETSNAAFTSKIAKKKLIRYMIILENDYFNVIDEFKFSEFNPQIIIFFFILRLKFRNYVKLFLEFGTNLSLIHNIYL